LPQTPLKIRRQIVVWLGMTALMVSLAGCLPQADNEVIVLSALDREFSQPVLSDAASELDLTIRPKFDQESNKTIGLATEIIQHRQRPTADVFWNNEVLHTIRLQRLGLLESHQPPRATAFPKSYRSPAGYWHGFAGRARVLIVNTKLLPDSKQWPDSIYDFADSKWKGRCTIARPTFGTTATHAAVLIATLGQERGTDLLKTIASNATFQGGNKQVAQKVASGQFAFGMTDTDDAMIEYEQGQPVAIVFPDQGDDQMGTLMIPNTLAIIKNGPNTERAKRLVDRLLQTDIEQRLAAGKSAQCPLATELAGAWRVQQGWLKNKGPRESQELKMMAVDFEQAAAVWDEMKQFLAELKSE
jgi:iron(III) transport system substrate-binding protein